MKYYITMKKDHHFWSGTVRYEDTNEDLLIEIEYEIPYTASQIQRVVFKNEMYNIKQTIVDIDKNRTVYFLEENNYNMRG